MAQHLPHGLIGAAIIGFGPGFLRLEGEQTPGLEGLQELIVALAAVAVFLGEGGDVFLFLQTLAFDEQEETVGQGVGGWKKLSWCFSSGLMGWRPGRAQVLQRFGR